ncbi:MAG: hypothetical protein IJ257_07590 [Treponema sp.]|nr:hypothetical protein [Treponema sp.]
MPKKQVLQKIRILFFLSFSSLLFSCSNADTESAVAEEKITLRSTADALYDSIIWTDAIEVDRLTTNVSSVQGISSRLNLTPLIVLAGQPDDSSRVFPSLKNFGSLDTSLIPQSLRTMLTSFSESISKYKEADSFMAKDCLYSLALFYTDFRRIFGDCFGLDVLPAESDSQVKEKEASESDSSASASDSEKSEGELEASEAEGAQLVEKSYFTSFVLGQPFLNGIYYEVPVKFFSEQASMTLCIFCFENSGTWKIDQIQITDWELFNGKK